eukprot:gene2372-8680_t
MARERVPKASIAGAPRARTIERKLAGIQAVRSILARFPSLTNLLTTDLQPTPWEPPNTYASIVPRIIHLVAVNALLSCAPPSSEITRFTRGGNVFVADTGNNCIRKVTRSGYVISFAGVCDPDASGFADGQGPDARFNRPLGIAADNMGNIFVTDYSNSCIRKISPVGEVTTFAGLCENNVIDIEKDGPREESRWGLPMYISIDQRNNDMYITSGLQCIRKISGSDGMVTTLPHGSCIAGGIQYVEEWGDYMFNSLQGIVMTEQNRLFAVDDTCIVELLDNGEVERFAGACDRSGFRNGKDALFDALGGINADQNGNLITADITMNCIRKTTRAGITTTLAGECSQTGNGTANGSGDKARFQNPWAAAVGVSGLMYVVDTANNCIRKITPQGFVSTHAGTCGLFLGGGSDFLYPQGVAIF